MAEGEEMVRALPPLRPKRPLVCAPSFQKGGICLSGLVEESLLPNNTLGRYTFVTGWRELNETAGWRELNRCSQWPKGRSVFTMAGELRTLS